MKRMALPFILLALMLLAASHLAGATTTKKQAKAKKKPDDRVVVMYFHRTKRCPTCLRLGSYSEEAVVKGFAKQIKDGTVEFHYIDFQDKKNAALTKGYKISGPSLIVAKIVKNKVAKVANLKEIWSKNRDKDVFLKYVRDQVVAYQKPVPQTARAEHGGTSTRTSK